MGNVKSKVGPGEPNPQQSSIEADEAVFVQEKKRRMEPPIKTIPFIIKKKFVNDGLEEEYLRQIKGQQEGLGKLTIAEYLKNRQAYKDRKKEQKDKGKKNPSGRAKEGSIAQRKAREVALVKKSREIRENNKSISRNEANNLAEEWLKTQAALHDPDQIAGGNPENITGMGDARVNSSMGSQWRAKSRAQAVENQVMEYIKENNIPESEWDDILLDIEIVYEYE